jgi:hypothetical protein
MLNFAVENSNNCYSFVCERRLHMSEERAKILEMLRMGKVTTVQANLLIEALGEEPLSATELWSVQSDEQSREPLRQQQEPPAHAEARELPSFTFDEIIKLSEHEVDPSYLKTLRDAGLTNLTVEQIIKLHDHEVDPSHIKKFREAGLTDLTHEQLIELSNHEIDPDYVMKLREAGLTNLTYRQIIELHDHEVDPSFLLKFKTMGLHNLPFKQIIALSEHEIDPAYVEALLSETSKRIP